MKGWGFSWPTCPEAGTGKPGYEAYAEREAAATALLADKLYEGVDYDSVEQKPDDAPLPVVVQQKPLYKRWWFWTAIGVVVAGGASALAVGLTLRQPSCPDGNTCTGNLVYSLQIPF